MNKHSRILITGASGLVGSTIMKLLIDRGFTCLFGTYYSRSIDFGQQASVTKVDLRNQAAVATLFEKTNPEYVFLAAAKVGGIMANNVYRADFIHDNLLIHINIIHQSYLSRVKKLLYLGSTCIYPRDCPQPMKEEFLLTSPLEYTNEPYAIAKIAGLKMCENFNVQYGTNYISVMPTNLYGPGDNFDLEKAHVLPALIRKIHLARLFNEGRWDDMLTDLGVVSDDEAKAILDKFGIAADKVEIWGTGSPKREFLWSQDMADACIFVMERVDFDELPRDKKEVRNTHINIGSGKEISIGDLAQAVKEVVGFKGELFFNTDKPDGTPRKLTDVSRLHGLGWKHKVELEDGLKMFYEWYLER
ncbi:GDP-L-fucose synthase [Desulfobacter postgatei]|uniref:GDP-L-fucose synthase family protein n=1 Tax=Desulfobacter postgatei TaxID=2293 RepID=UPI00259B90E0|nr:GDP-L-fucose synthase [uncultured Desulfobacter sp.]